MSAPAGRRSAPAGASAEYPAGRYAPVARILHWTTAVLVIAMIPAGFVLLDLPPGPIQDVAFDAHRSTGLLLLVLTFGRLAVRATRPAPPLPASIPPLQQRVAGAVHVALYALLIAMPLVGWWATSAYGAPIRFFGLFTVPPLVAPDKALAETGFAIHRALGIAFGVIIAAHAAAALHHHFAKRDGVLRRML